MYNLDMYLRYGIFRVSVRSSYGSLIIPREIVWSFIACICQYPAPPDRASGIQNEL